MDAPTPPEESDALSLAGRQLVLFAAGELGDWILHRIDQGDDVVLMTDGSWVCRDSTQRA